MKLKQLLGCIAGSLLLIAATSRPISIPEAFSETLTMDDRELKVSARVYSADESEHFLHADLLAKGYVPVEITILNEGDHTYGISAASTAMNSAKPKEIVSKLTRGAMVRGIGLRVLSFFFWPLMIPSTIDSIHTYKKRGSLTRVLTAKGFKQFEEIVLPYSIVKRVLYVPKEAFYETFSVALEDLSSKELVVIRVTA